MSQPLHTGPATTDACLRADWLHQPEAEQCDTCQGSGQQVHRWVADGIPFKADIDLPCEDCNGTGTYADAPEPDEGDEHWLPGIDDVPDHVREGDR